MEAILIIIAVHTKDPKDIPAKVWFEFPSIQECEKVKNTMQFDFKFKQFIAEVKCQRKS